MGEYADEAREQEYLNLLNMSKSERYRHISETKFEKQSYNFKAKENYDNTIWRDRTGKTTSFLDMDGFHLWNIRTFILRSHNRGLENKLMYIDLALGKLNYTLDDYKKDCEKLVSSTD